MNERRRKFWGWGWEDEGPSPEQRRKIAAVLAERFDLGELPVREPPALSDLRLREPRVAPPPALEPICRAEAYDRAGHSYGKSFRDVVRGLQGDFDHPPDLVAFPRGEQDVIDLLDWCTRANVVAIPYGGGSSVVGGVEPPERDERPVVSIDLGGLDRVLEIDRASRCARIQAGVYGPSLEDQLRPHGYTLRHFPQSFEFSTLGGWIATRSGGHFATLYTHIDDFVESLRVVTPAGTLESRRLPGSGAGPSPDRLFLGSEGTLGVITEAWMRLQDRPRFRAQASVTFDTFEAGAAAVRAVSQAGLFPSNCRLLDADEARTAGAGDGSRHVLLVAFESADHELDPWMQRALECCRDHGGDVPDGAGRTVEKGEGAREGAAGAWRSSFVGAPYLRDALVSMGVISETFETSITWDRFPDFHERVMQATRDAVVRVCGGGQVTCRFTHAYPDGPAPYYSVIAPGRSDGLISQWQEIKNAAAEALIDAGGSITHHHAVGRDHRPWYDRQRPELFASVLMAAKRQLDPQGVLNPGVLVG